MSTTATKETSVVAPDPIESAKEAGLRYVSDEMPGIRRKRAGKGFTYVGPDGTKVTDRSTLERIRKLAIPPAWTDVWICANPRGHIQVTARDAKGRKQYRYHPKWQEVRDEAKYERMIAFAEALPRIRQRVEQDMALPGLSREKVLATVVKLLEATLIRVGNEEYARENHSYGLTTLRTRHVRVNGSELRFRFRGKSGRQHDVAVTDRRLARVVERCQDLPGQALFQYRDDEGEYHSVESDDVNAYLREIAEQEFTAKDFRTWAGTVLAAMALKEVAEFDSEAQAKKNVVRAIEQVAERLGNTKAVCRKCYVHPAVIDAYLEGTTLETLKQNAEREMRESLRDLRPEEAAVIGLLQQRLAREAVERNGTAQRNGKAGPGGR